MPNKVMPKRSYTANSVPLTTDLEVHELAINWADGVAYTKDASGQIVSVPLGGSGGGGGGISWASVPASATATGTAGQIAYDADYLYLATATNTWKRAALSSWSSFTPATIAGLQLWLDASDASTLYDATSGGSLVAADGGVARWEDKSGNNRNFTQSDSSKRPARKTSQQNSLDTLLFDGSNDSLIGSDFASGTGGLTIFSVVKRNATDAVHEIINKGVDNGGWLFRFTDTNVAQISSYRDSTLNNSTLRGTSSSVSATGYTVLAMVAGSGAFNTASMFRNGTSLTMGAAVEAGTNGRTPSSGSDPARIGVQVYAGVDYFNYNGNIAEVIIYDSALSDANREAVENYLLAKWAIS